MQSVIFLHRIGLDNCIIMKKAMLKTDPCYKKKAWRGQLKSTVKVSFFSSSGPFLMIAKILQTMKDLKKRQVKSEFHGTNFIRISKFRIN